MIGNPPYVSAPTQLANETLAKQRDTLVKIKQYNSLCEKWDLYIPFIERGLQLAKTDGVVTMIVPFPLTNQKYGKVLRKMLTQDYNMFELVDLNGTKIFDNATVSNCIPFVKKQPTQNKCTIAHINEQLEITPTFEQNNAELVQDKKTQVWNLTKDDRKGNKHSDMHVLGDYCYISVGMVLNSDEKEKENVFKKGDLISDVENEIHCRKFIEGKDIGKYCINTIRYLEYDTERVPDLLRRPTFRELYKNPKLMFNRLGELQVVLDSEGDFTTSDAMFVCLLWNSLSGVINKSITSSIKKFSKYSRLEMEKLSETVDLKYLLAIMNSKYAAVLLTNQRGGDYHIYPEHIRNIPIPTATVAQQEPIIALVDKILVAKKQDPKADTLALEAQIDQLVYKLYGLTQEEIAVVEGK
ncbi:MAG: Eco57I restriction-modification methylase domain-containing protein [Spirochaetia bacterium]|nr:Eco57I restriction-modification methylase domain-containing protein [Spirochaetia bacterium]